MNTVPAAMPLDLVAPAACSSCGSLYPAPAGAVAAAGESPAGSGDAPDASGSAAAVLDDGSSVAGVVAAGVVVVSDGGEADPSPSPASASHGLGRWQTLGMMVWAWPRMRPTGLGASLDAAQRQGACACRKLRSWEQQSVSVAELTPKT